MPTASAGRLRLLLVLALVAGFLAWDGASTQLPQAQAADPWSFRAGTIISDAVFFNAGSMNAGAVQTFLTARNPSCRPGTDGSPCLKDFHQDTWTRPADGICDHTYAGAAWESAATIIYKVAQACQINPQVLIVMLQKEQALVTASGGSVTAGRYRIAMGMGCPDTAACDSQYYGFFNQVYGAAHQMQRYATYPANYGYRAGRNNTILYSPRGAAACGSSSVYITNQATAGLYNYTPYQPNNAALAAGYGTGDSCSAYGNRNFYLYFTDWFGSTDSYTTSGAIGGLWTSLGGASGSFGLPIGNMFCGLTDGGCGQHFQNGSIYWSSATGARAVSGAIRYAWSVQGWESGTLGYPVDSMTCTLPANGCVQNFQGGQIVWSDGTGARALTTGVVRAWTAAGGITGMMGFPTADRVCTLPNGACRQDFQGGNVYSTSGTGDHAVVGGIRTYWLGAGAEQGVLGYPSGDVVCDTTSCSQQFQGGQIGWTPTYGHHIVSGAIGARWTTDGAGGSPVGYPIGDAVCGISSGGCRQDFEKGAVYWSPGTGAWPVLGDIRSYWQQQGADTSAFGYPTGAQTCTAKGCTQQFQASVLAASTAGGVHGLWGAIGVRWRAQDDGGALGYPTGDMDCRTAPERCSQSFQNGHAYWSPATATYTTTGGLDAGYTARSGPTGGLGLPLAEAVCDRADGGCAQPFQGGTLVYSPSVGAYAVSGGIGAIWWALGAERSSLGYPTADMGCDASGCSQTFQKGYLTWAPGGGVIQVSQAIGDLWAAQGGATGWLGYPVGHMACGLTGGGCRQAFQSGTVYWSAASGAHTVFGAIAGVWAGMGAEQGSLSYPTSDMTCAAAGCSQQFQGGQLAWGERTGTQLLSGAIGQLWSAQGGVSGALGVPTGKAVCSAGCSQTFQNGVVVWSAGTGAHALSGALQTYWSRAGGTSGTLGYPTGDAYPVAGGIAQDFQGGRLTYSSLSGAVTRG